MSVLGPAKPLPEITEAIDRADLARVREAGQPVVLRGLVSDWPLVAAARRGDEAVVAYLQGETATRPIGAIVAPPEEKGRFFYNRDLTGFNFHSGRGDVALFLADLLRAAAMDDPPGLAVQSEDLADLWPGVADANRLAILPQVRPRIWIGNRIRVAPHYDLKENIACCVAGRRRFTVFPPEETANLYPGPLEVTPAGAPVSMVDLEAPDLAKYPRFAAAWGVARTATLAPGDAIYLPYGWWHGVDSLEPVSILVNYWWTEPAPDGIGSPNEALLHALLALRHMPSRERAIWREKFEFYVFESDGDPAAHLPDHARGVLARPSASLFARMKAMLRQQLG